MVQNQAALECCVGVRCRWVLDQIHHCAEFVEAHGADGVGELLPLAGDVRDLKLELCGGEPGIESLWPKLAKLHLAWSLLLMLGTGGKAVSPHLHYRWLPAYPGWDSVNCTS